MRSFANAYIIASTASRSSVARSVRSSKSTSNLGALVRTGSPTQSQYSVSTAHYDLPDLPNGGGKNRNTVRASQASGFESALLDGYLDNDDAVSVASGRTSLHRSSQFHLDL